MLSAADLKPKDSDKTKQVKVATISITDMKVRRNKKVATDFRKPCITELWKVHTVREYTKSWISISLFQFYGMQLAGGPFLPLVEPEAASLPLVGVGLSTSQPPPYTVEDGILWNHCRTFFPSESCKETHLNALNPQSWLQVERGKLSKVSPHSPSSLESLIKVPDPPILPYFKPVDYVEVLAQIHKELESCPPHERPNLYLLQFQVFKGLGDIKLMRRSLRLAWLKASTVHERLVFGAWLKYEKRGEELISDLLSSCGKCSKEFGLIDIGSELPSLVTSSLSDGAMMNQKNCLSGMVSFRIGDEKITCDRQKMAALSPPFHSMLNGCFRESFSEDIDLSKNDLSPKGMKIISEFSSTGVLPDIPTDLLLEIMVFSSKFCCEKLRDSCDRKLSKLVSSRNDAVELMEYAFDENCPVLAGSCLQIFLQELPDSLNDERVVELLTSVGSLHRKIMVGTASFALYCLLSQVAMDLDPLSEATDLLLEQLVDSTEDSRQKMVAYHMLGCVKLFKKEYNEAERFFEAALTEGHVYSIVGLSRIGQIKGNKAESLNKLNSVISTYNPLGWMHQERSLYCENDEKRWEDLEKATELDPTLTYPYMYRAASLMKKQNVQDSMAEINKIIGFKLAVECLELRFCFYLVLEDYQSAICDVQAILTICPDYRMFEGRVPATQFQTLVREHVPSWTTADCWLQLYDRWSAVDDIGSLSVIYQMLESEAAKGVLYFRQSLLLLRLNCPEAAMRSLQLARQHASSDHERLVYEGWILYDTGHCDEGLTKAEESITLNRSFEAFFLKAYALADSSQDPTCSSTVVSLLQDALKCPSDRLRKGQALNNLGSVYVDSGKLDLAADCYINALKIRHTRAHQGLARVHYLKNDKAAAYEEMTKLIEKARNNASAYEKRSEYCEREQTKIDLEMVTRLDPLRVYPYRYRAAGKVANSAVLMDNHKEKEAIAELSRAIAFKADLHLLHLRAAFHEHIGDVSGAMRDCRAALSFDPNHQEMLELRSRYEHYKVTEHSNSESGKIEFKSLMVFTCMLFSELADDMLFSELTDECSGVDFRRWQKKMHFLLSTISVVYVLTTPMPENGEKATVEQIQKRSKWENDDYVCHGIILNGMFDSLSDLYQNLKSGKELWDSLEANYMAEDASSKKFVTTVKF
ncbi:ETO1-like protein 1, partial [Tanacetum coccineum]